MTEPLFFKTSENGGKDNVQYTLLARNGNNEFDTAIRMQITRKANGKSAYQVHTLSGKGLEHFTIVQNGKAEEVILDKESAPKLFAPKMELMNGLGPDNLNDKYVRSAIQSAMQSAIQSKASRAFINGDLKEIEYPQKARTNIWSTRSGIPPYSIGDSWISPW